MQMLAEIKDKDPLIDVYVEDEWQLLYNSSMTGAAYRMLEPAVSSKMKFANQYRRKQTVISRLRLGKCQLNVYLHEIHRHPDGKYISDVSEWMASSRLKLNPDKTELMWCSTSRMAHHIDHVTPFVIDGISVTPATCVRLLGVQLDSELTMTTHLSRTVS